MPGWAVHVTTLASRQRPCMSRVVEFLGPLPLSRRGEEGRSLTLAVPGAASWRRGMRVIKRGLSPATPAGPGAPVQPASVPRQPCRGGLLTSPRWPRANDHGIRDRDAPSPKSKIPNPKWPRYCPRGQARPSRKTSLCGPGMVPVSFGVKFVMSSRRAAITPTPGSRKTRTAV